MEATSQINETSTKIPNNGYDRFDSKDLHVIETAIVKDILELEDVKGCLNHFLASHNSQLYANTACEASNQKTIVQENLRELYAGLKIVRAKMKPVKVINLRANADEAKAIALFNKDKRFTITE